MNQKGLAPIFIVIILAATLLGGYLVYINYLSLSRVKSRDNQSRTTYRQITQSTPQPFPTSADETGNWKIYTNTKIGLELKYPPKLQFQETEEASSNDTSLGTIPTVIFIDPTDKSEFPNLITIRVFDAKGQNAELLTEKIVKAYFPANQGAWKDIVKGSFRGSYIEASGGVENGIAVISLSGEQLFYFHLTNKDDNRISKDDFFKILSTFRFFP